MQVDLAKFIRCIAINFRTAGCALAKRGLNADRFPEASLFG
jgi:hypothetical protein